MPRKPLTEEEKARVRRKACQAARNLIAQEGASALTIRRIAEEIGMSAMSLYTYFENKANLIAHLQEDALSEIADEQERVLQNGGKTAEILENLETSLIYFAIQRPDDFIIAFQRTDSTGPTEGVLREYTRAKAPCVEITKNINDLDPDAVWNAWFGRANLILAGFISGHNSTHDKSGNIAASA